MSNWFTSKKPSFSYNKVSYAFAVNLYDYVSTSYKDPYDTVKGFVLKKPLWFNFSNEPKKLCQVQKGVVVHIFTLKETYKIIVRWAILCAERVLPIYLKTSDDPRPASAIKAAKICFQNSNKSGYATRSVVYAKQAYLAAPVNSAASFAAYAVYAATDSASHINNIDAAIYAAIATSVAATEAVKDMTSDVLAERSVLAEIQWQRKTLQDIVDRLISGPIMQKLPLPHDLQKLINGY